LAFAPIATAPAPLALLLLPIATDPAPLALLPRPTATDPPPLALLPRPIATDPRPLALLRRPTATDPAPVALLPAALEPPEGSTITCADASALIASAPVSPRTPARDAAPTFRAEGTQPRLPALARRPNTTHIDDRRKTAMIRRRKFRDSAPEMPTIRPARAARPVWDRPSFPFACQFNEDSPLISPTFGRSRAET
jgi:hypothetical protein